MITLDIAPQTLKKAHQAHQHMLKGDVLMGFRLYNRVTNKNLIPIFCRTDTKSWVLSNVDASVALDDLCIYLIEYALSRNAWKLWQPIAKKVLEHPQYAQIEAEKRARIEAVNIFGQRLTRHNFTLERHIQTLHGLLADIPHDCLSAMIVRMVLGTTYRLLRQKDEALEQLYHVREHLSINEHPFYHILNEELIGDVIYFLNQGQRKYYLQAVEVYQETERLALAQIGTDFAHQPYNLGWVYAELGELEQAEHEFKRGLARAYLDNAEYEKSQYQYGLGFVYLRQENHDQAREMLNNALHYFSDISHIYTIACLNLLALVDDNNTQEALKWLKTALIHLEKVDDPVHLSHVYKNLSRLYWRQSDFWQAITYQVQHYWIKLRYNMPLFFDP